MLTQPPPFYVWADTQMLSVESEHCHFPTWWPPRFQMATANNSARFIHRCLLQFLSQKNSQTKKNYTKTATFPTAILLVEVFEPYNLYQHLQFPSLSIGNCGSPNLRCGLAVPSSLDSSALLRCCLALCCSASVELGSTSSCKKAGKAIWMLEVFSSKCDFEQQLQMCMYILYIQYAYILLHTITYYYIFYIYIIVYHYRS